MYMMLVPRKDFDVFDNFFDDPFFRREKSVHPLMKTDIKETDKSYIINMDLPGFDKKDIQIDVENGYLNINAKSDTSNKEEEEEGKFIRRERYYGECSRSFYIGEDFCEDDIKATFKNGILSLDIPKVKEEEKKEEKKFIEISE